VALSVDNTLSQSTLAEERDRAHVLLEVETTLAASLDLKQLLLAAASSLHQVVSHDSASISYFDERADSLRECALDPAAGYANEGIPIALGDSLPGRVFRRQEVLLFDRDSLETLQLPDAKRLVGQGIRSASLIPLTTAKGPVGVLRLASNSDDAFPPDRLGLLKQVAALLALRLENALVHCSLMQQRERMQVLLGVSTALSANWNLQQVFPKISAYLRRLLRQEYASIALHDEKTGAMVRQVVDFPLGKGLLAQADLGVPMADSPAGKAMAARAPMIFSRQEIAGFASDFTAKIQQEGIKSVCCVPLSAPRGLFGTLNLASTRAMRSNRTT
jgi:transcriptional regulator with GAF, ATPase, and Fis domain